MGTRSWEGHATMQGVRTDHGNVDTHGDSTGDIGRAEIVDRHSKGTGTERVAFTLG